MSQMKADNKTIAASVRQFLFAALMTLTLKCSMTVVGGLESSSALLRFFSKFSNSFYSGGLMDLLLFFALLFALRYADRQGKRLDPPILILSCVFSALYLISYNFARGRSFDFFTANPYQYFLVGFCFAGFSLLFYTALSLAEGLLLSPCREQAPASPHLQRNAFLLILLCWLPWTVMNYPGSFCPDSVHQVLQVLGLAPWSDHQPVLSTALMGLCLRLGELTVSRNFGCFLYLLLQTIIGALVFSLIVKKLAELGAGRGLYLAALLFFALTPMWGCFAQWFEKDLLSAEISALAVLLLADVVKRGALSGRAAAGLAATVLLVSLLRKAAIYEFVPALLLLLFVLKGADRRRCAAMVCAVLLAFTAISEVLYPALGIAKGSVREALSIPFQQTAMYVNRFPDEVTPEERAAIDAVLDYERLDNYAPMLSDPVKATYREDSSKLPAYFSAWLKMFFKHPGSYVEAFFLQCSGFLAPGDPDLSAYISKNCFDLEEQGIYRVFDELPTGVFDSIRQFSISAPAIDMLSSPGLYTWISLACLVLLLKRRKYSALLPLAPGLMNVLSCIASPMCTGLRYELPLVAATPFLIGWTWAALKESE